MAIKVYQEKSQEKIENIFAYLGSIKKVFKIEFEFGLKTFESNLRSFLGSVLDELRKGIRNFNFRIQYNINVLLHDSPGLS